MTEAEWLACDEPLPMLDGLEGEVADGLVGDRQLRLFVCACSRRLWHLLTDETRHDVELAECFVDGGASEEELYLAYLGEELPGEPAIARCCLWQDAAYGSPYYYLNHICRSLSDHKREGEEAAQAGLLRDILGNRFRPVTADPSWLTLTVTALASQMYDSRDFSAMPILADALQDAGCDNADILDHCRGSGPHVRGCWVLDLVLGKK
jgi:hypothetical protein